jgi:DNA-binding FadR family transcriptional regulator
MLYDRSDRYRVTTLRSEKIKEIVHEEHRAIAHAIRERDAARAAVLMHEHTATSFARIHALPLPTD